VLIVIIPDNIEKNWRKGRGKEEDVESTSRYLWSMKREKKKAIQKEQAVVAIEGRSAIQHCFWGGGGKKSKKIDPDFSKKGRGAKPKKKSGFT